MTKQLTTLRGRLVLTHLAVVAIGAITLLVTANRLAPSCVDQHLQMGMEASMMDHQVVSDLRSGALSGFDQALLVAAAAATATAILTAILASRRLIRPLDSVRVATKRLAEGFYSNRVPRPQLRELAALADDVNTLASILESTERTRIQLISEVAHELRTPLATIKGYVEGLVDGVFEPDKVLLSSIGKEVRRIERLATDLGELSRSEEAGTGLRLEPSDLTGLVREAAERLRPQFDDQGVSLEVVAGPSVHVDVDRDRMAQVLTNIIGNALTYTPRGGRVRAETESSDGEARCIVTDTGRGLEPRAIESVFERFYRVDRSTPGGTGIGLTIARSIARRHGGDVTASSAGLGRGATFIITLPLRKID